MLNRSFRSASAALVAIASFCATAGADTILLKNGRRHEGRILEQTSSEVRFKTKVGAIVTVLTVKRHEIARLTEGPLPPGFFPDEAAPHAPDAPAEQALPIDPPTITDEPRPADEAPHPTTTTTSSDAARYLLVPIHGVIGEQTLADGLEEALKVATTHNITHIVFDLDTPGGYVTEADRLVAVINGHRERTRARGREVAFHAVIRNAISAGIWVVFACDTIHISDGGTIGGAVAYSRHRTTGAAQVDAKLNSILAAQIGSMARRNGHEPQFARAMIVMEEELHAWKEGDTVRVSGSRPSNPRARAELIDGPTTVLTLTAHDAVRLALASPAPRGPQGIGETLGLADWSPAGNAGEAAMARAASAALRDRQRAEAGAAEAEKLRAEAEHIMNSLLPLAADRAAAADPANGRYTVNTVTRQLTPESRREWQRRTDEAVAAWNDVLAGLRQLDRMDKRHKQLTGNGIVLRSSGRFVARDIERNISQLRANRDRTTM